MERLRLTPELCAKAIVAACASYGDHPIRALEAKGGHLKRGVSVAALAVVQATGLTARRIESVFHLQASTLTRSRRNANEAHGLALTAALAAIGGVQLTLVPTAPSRPPRPDPETVSGKPDRLLAPNPVPVVDHGKISAAEPCCSDECQDSILMGFCPHQAPTPKLALPAPSPPECRAEPSPAPRESRDQQIKRMLGDGATNRDIVQAVGVTIGVVAGVRARLKARAGGATLVAHAPMAKVDRPSASPKFEGLARLEREPAAPARVASKLSDCDRELVEAAIAAGKVRQVDKDDGTELVFDPDQHAYARFPRSELEFVAEHGWRKASSRGRRAASAGGRGKVLAITTTVQS